MSGGAERRKKKGRGGCNLPVRTRVPWRKLEKKKRAGWELWENRNVGV